MAPVARMAASAQTKKRHLYLARLSQQLYRHSHQGTVGSVFPPMEPHRARGRLHGVLERALRILPWLVDADGMLAASNDEGQGRCCKYSR